MTTPTGSNESTTIDESTARLPAGNQRWFGLVIALLIVAAAVAIARPDQRGGGNGQFGLVDQVKPAAASAADLPTAPQPGELAPNFRLATLDGETVLLSDLRGRPIFLNFWATWCFACVTEMPAMQRLADKYGDDILVVGVNVGQTADIAEGFATREGIRYLLLLDPETEVTKGYEVRAMPTSLFIDPDGVVASVRYGVLTPPEMEAHLAPLLTDPASA